jgi:hypothetical protein
LPLKEIIRKLKRFKITFLNGKRIINTPLSKFQRETFEDIGLFIDETFKDPS